MALISVETDANSVTVVRFAARRFLDQDIIEQVGDELRSLFDDDTTKAVVLDLTGVEFMSSAMNGKIILLNKLAIQAGGQLVLCAMHPEVRETFKNTKLDRAIEIVANQRDALRLFQQYAVVVTCPMVGCGSAARTVCVTTPKSGVCCISGSCPQCDVHFIARADQLTSAGQFDAEIETLRFRTLESGDITLTISRYDLPRYTVEIRVTGLLDLDATDLVEQLWSTLRSPRRVLIDVSTVSRFDHDCVKTMEHFLGQAEADKAAVLVSQRGQGLGMFESEGVVFTSREEAIAALHPIPTGATLPSPVSCRCVGEPLIADADQSAAKSVERGPDPATALAIADCPHCGVKVVPLPDNICPSCRGSFDEPPAIWADVVTSSDGARTKSVQRAAIFLSIAGIVLLAFAFFVYEWLVRDDGSEDERQDSATQSQEITHEPGASQDNGQPESQASHEDTVMQVCRIAAEQFAVDVAAVRPDTSLDDLGGDELDALELVMQLEERFDVHIPDAAFNGLTPSGDWQDDMRILTMSKFAEIVEQQKRTR